MKWILDKLFGLNILHYRQIVNRADVGSPRINMYEKLFYIIIYYSTRYDCDKMPTYSSQYLQDTPSTIQNVGGAYYT